MQLHEFLHICNAKLSLSQQMKILPIIFAQIDEQVDDTAVEGAGYRIQGDDHPPVEGTGYMIQGDARPLVEGTGNRVQGDDRPLVEAVNKEAFIVWIAGPFMCMHACVDACVRAVPV